jgi:hypothetical protein
MFNEEIMPASPEASVPKCAPRKRPTPRRWNVGSSLAAVVLLVTGLSASALAKVSAAPGKDGAPPDPQDEAAADALNDALEGPDEGQSTEDWMAELDAAHTDLYGYGIFSTPSSEPELDCSVVDDEADIGCDGDPTWITYSEPFDMVLSRSVHCPYPSYVACLQAGQSVDYCKRHVLNCHEGARTEASATVSMSARQCNEASPCFCGQASGDITLYGTSVIDGDEVCLTVESYHYDGNYDQYVEPEIEDWLDANDWEVCMPLACVE